MANDENQKNEGLGWMYKGNKVDSDEFLLGKQISKAEHFAPTKKEEEPEIPTNSSSGPTQEEIEQMRINIDMCNKIREDPLFIIKKQEMEAKERLLNNPIRMKQLEKLLAEKKGSDKKEKRKRRRKSGDSSDSSGDELLNTFLSLSGANKKKKAKSPSNGRSVSPSQTQWRFKKDRKKEGADVRKSPEYERVAPSKLKWRYKKDRKHDIDEASRSPEYRKVAPSELLLKYRRDRNNDEEKNRRRISPEHEKYDRRSSHHRHSPRHNERHHSPDHSRSHRRSRSPRSDKKSSHNDEGYSRREYSSSKDSPRYGLQSSSKGTASSKHVQVHSKVVAKPNAGTTSTPKKPSPEKKPKRSKEEMARLREEMVSNVEWRDSNRSENVKKLQAAEKAEIEKDEKAKSSSKKQTSYVTDLMSEHADSASVSDSIRSHKHYLQNSRSQSDKKFTEK